MKTLHANTDARLEHVRAAADPRRMRELLGACLARQSRPESIEGLAVQRLFYMPGSDFCGVYELQLRHGDAAETQILFGNIRYEDDAAEQAAKAARKAAKGKFVQPRLGAAAWHVPEIGMVLWTYPNDPKLDSLRANLQISEVRRALAQLHGPPGVQNGWELGAVTHELVRYIPRKRCVFRYEVEWRAERGPGGEPRALPASLLQHVYGKVYEQEAEARQAQALLAAMWRASQADGRWLRVPQPLRLDTTLCVLLQSALPGTHLTRQAASVGPDLAGEAGRGLALLNQAKLPLGAVLRLEDELEKLRLHAGMIALVHPDLTAVLTELVARCEAALPRLPRLPLMPAHGTFKLNHLLYDGERLGLVDFDSMVLADPLYDVANFTADLHYLEAAGALPAGRAAKLGRAFHESYCAHVPWGRRDAVLDWYVASLLVRKQAMKCVKHLHADAAVKMHAVLHEAQARTRRLGS